MKINIFLFAVFAIYSLTGFAQMDKDQLALTVSKVDAENMEKLKEYIWKFHADVSGEGGAKTTLVSEFSFDENGDLSIKVVDGQTNIQKKPGVRGRMQQNAIEDKLAYVSKTMKYALAYTYMTKGQLLDFFDKADVTEKNGVLVASGKNVYVEGDQLTVRMDAESKFYLSKSFETKMGEDPISGEVQYDTFKSSGINHITTTELEMPAEGVSIDGENKDYTIRIE